MTALSQRQFAKEIGRSNVWVSKLVKAGKLPVNEDGKIPLGAGLEAYNASQQVGYDANRAHGEKQRAASKGGSPKKARAPAAAPELPDDDGDHAIPTGSVTTAKLAEAFNRARTAEKTYQAKLKELEYKNAQGLYLTLAEVEEDAKETGSAIIERLRSVAPRVAPLCEGKPAREIEGIVDEAINDALAALQKSRFSKGQ